MSEELLPCPFCGCPLVSVNALTSTFYALCHGCGVSSASTGSREKAIELWNRRAAPKPQRSDEEPSPGTVMAAEIREKVQAMRKDSDRLDWAEINKEKIFCITFDIHASNDRWSISTPPTDRFSGAPIIGQGDTLRAAIDAAMDGKERGE